MLKQCLTYNPVDPVPPGLVWHLLWYYVSSVKAIRQLIEVSNIGVGELAGIERKCIMTETATIETERTEEMTQGGESAQRQAEQMVDAWTINQIDTVLARITEGFGAWLGPKYKAGGRRELTDAWANPGQSAQDYLKVIIGKIRTQLQLTADCMQCSSHSIPENHRAIVNPDFCNPQIDLFVGAVLQNAGARKEFKKIVKARKEDLK